MATLKENQQAMVDLMAHGSAIPASAMRLAHAMHDVLAAMTLDPNLLIKSISESKEVSRAYTTPGLNDKALAADIEACRPKDSMFDRARAAERRVKELENTVKQLRASNAKLKEERDYWITTCRGAEQTLIRTRQELETTKALPEQAGCRKDDTQLCAHEWLNDGYQICCRKCGVEE